jgi:aminocarboxymuconate-semialdehyde decarboxylase
MEPATGADRSALTAEWQGKYLSPVRVDLHTHILPREWPDMRDVSGYGGWVRLEHEPGRSIAQMVIDDTPFRTVFANTWDPLARLEEADFHGVDIQVLSTVPVMFSYWAQPQHALALGRLLNDHIADVVRDHPTRFVGLGTIPLQAPELAIAELERCVGELGLAGVQIGTHVDGLNLGEPVLYPVFEAASDLGAAVFVHPWDMLGGERLARYWLSWLVGMPAETAVAISSLLFGGVLERLPRLRIGFAHGGGAFPGQIGRIQHGFEVRPDLCAVDTQLSPADHLAKDGRPARFYVDSLVHDADALRRLIQLFGAERVALGTDYPFPLGEAEPGRLIRSLGLDAASEAALLGGTALEFLGLDAARLARGAAA